MANYPYTGGIYGGYSDPANNKKKTIVGPKADNALAQLPATINANPDVGASMVSDAGSMARGVLQKTPGGYPNIGLSTPPAASRPARDMLLNVPGNDGQPAAPPANPLSTMPANVPMIKPGMVKQRPALNSMPATAPSANPAEPNVHAAARQMLQSSPGGQSNDGLSMMPQTGPSYMTQMGKTGQDGYGRLSLNGNLPKTGSTMLNRGVPGQPNAYPVNATSLNKLGDTFGTTRGNGFEFHGKASDAAKFFAPSGVDRNSPEYQRFVEQERRKSNPMETDQEAFTRQSNDLALNNLRGLSGLQQQYLQSTDPAQLNQLGGKLKTMLSKDVSPVDQARIDSERLSQQKGQMEIDQSRKMQELNDQYLAEQDPAKQKMLGNKILTMQGKNSKEWQIITREEPVDPANPMAGMTKRPYAVNLADPNQSIELGAQGGRSSQYETAPTDSGSRKKGTVYSTPRGPLKWTGDGWTDEF